MKLEARGDTAGPSVGPRSETSEMLAKISAAAVIAISLLAGAASAQGYWTQMKPIPQGANEVIGAAADGLLYIYGGEREHTQHFHGGINPRTQPLGMFWAYDPKNDPLDSVETQSGPGPPRGGGRDRKEILSIRWLPSARYRK